MNPEQLAQLSDEELLDYAKKNKPTPWFDSFFIGFLVGIILFGAFNNAWGFLMLLPLFMIYLFLKKPKRHKALQHELNKRNLQ